MKFWIFLAMLSHACATDRLVVCGWDEIFQVDPTAKPATKLWSWKAKDHPEIPEAIRKTFGTTAECKPVENGAKLLIVSSGGGCGLLELPSGKALWWAKVSNAHSIEALPENRILVAGSTGAGNKLALFDARQSEHVIWETPLPSGHGIVWDSTRSMVWALGFKELRGYALKDWQSASPSLEMKSTHTLPDDDGHDLRAVPGSADLVLSTGKHVWLFDRDKGSFRGHPDLKNKEQIKAIDIHPRTGQLIFTQAQKPNWWTDTLTFLHPDAQIHLEGERIYKARWLVDPPKP